MLYAICYIICYIYEKYQVDTLNLLIEEGGELGEVVGLPGSLVLPNHLDVS